jgi:O-antigen/teichoic acid export membrane protein
MASKRKFLQRLLMISNGVIFQLLNAFSTAIVAYFVILNNHMIIWGKFAGIWVIISLFMVVFNFGNKDFLLKEYTKSNTKAIDITKYNMWLRTPFLLSCILISFLIFPLNQLFFILLILLVSFIFNSFYPLLVYEKKFNYLLLIELFAIVVQLVFLYISRGFLQLNDVIISFLMYYSIKFFSLFFIVRTSILTYSAPVNFKKIKGLIPFFLLAFGGMLVNKADFIIVTAMLDDLSKAHYQIISTFSTMGIIAAHAILQPFIKEIYRINWASFTKIATKYFLVGILLSFMFTVAVYSFSNLFFKINLSVISLVLLYFIELIFFATNPLIFFLFRNDKQHHLVKIVMMSGMFTLFTAYLLVKPYGINGALFANLIGNCLMLIFLSLLKVKIGKQLIIEAA